MRLGINLHFFFELYFQTMAAVLVRFEAGQNPVLKDIYLQFTLWRSCSPEGQFLSFVSLQM